MGANEQRITELKNKVNEIYDFIKFISPQYQTQQDIAKATWVVAINLQKVLPILLEEGLLEDKLGYVEEKLRHAHEAAEYIKNQINK